MKMNPCSINILNGVLLSVLVAAAVILTPEWSEYKFHGYLIRAEFENIGGLKANADVRLDNVIVGKVREIEYNRNGYTAVVSMIIGDAYPLTRDTSASVVVSGLLAEHYIGLDPGAEEAYLQPDGLIKLTQPALAFEQVMGQLLYSRGHEDLTGEKNL